MNRFLKHPSEKIAAHYDGLFGDPGWRDLMHAVNRIEALGDFYADQLRKHAEFLWSFRMLDEGNRGSCPLDGIWAAPPNGLADGERGG